jgi:methylmalonyl-CoA/ethylmalonyl-CoA epimerase
MMARSTEGELSLDRIGQVSVRVHDLARAVAFYRDTLGMRFLFEVPRMAFFDCGGVRLLLALPEGSEDDHPASVIYYAVDDIRRAHETLAARGVTFEDEPHLIARLPDREVWMTFFRDPDRNVLALMRVVPVCRRALS